ncbi:MAG: thymidylate synthase [Candidatus Nanohaloarchaea archaeon]
MEQYHELVEDVLENGSYEQNRTDVPTLAAPNQHYRIDLDDGFPLLTTKDLSGFRWNSLIHEILWYFSGEEHIRNLREETGIWDEWADEEGHLDTAYGRFWRRYPVPEEGAQLDGETWVDEGSPWVTEEDGSLVFDQLGYVIDTLNGENPEKDPYSRQLPINAWHPANAAASGLPPCHYTFHPNVIDDELNVSLTQRSGDIALGIPFNIAGYSIMTKIMSNETGFEEGELGHTIDDAHIYLGKGDRAEWYSEDENLEELQERVAGVDDRDEFLEVRDWLLEEAPEEEEEDYDHVPGLLLQLSREPRERPELEIADRHFEDLEFEDFELSGYNPYDGINFEVAE